MPTLRLVQAEEPETLDVIPFPEWARARARAPGGDASDAECPWEVPTDAAAVVERAIARAQDQLEELSDLLGPIPFPSPDNDDDRPTAA